MGSRSTSGRAPTPYADSPICCAATGTSVRIGLGLHVPHRATAAAPGEHGLLMLGWPAASWHLELVGGETLTPTAEDLLVLYLGPEAEAVALMADDPYVRAGLARYQAVGWQPSRGVLATWPG